MRWDELAMNTLIYPMPCMPMPCSTAVLTTSLSAMTRLLRSKLFTWPVQRERVTSLHLCSWLCNTAMQRASGGIPVHSSGMDEGRVVFVRAKWLNKGDPWCGPNPDWTLPEAGTPVLATLQAIHDFAPRWRGPDRRILHRWMPSARWGCIMHTDCRCSFFPPIGHRRICIPFSLLQIRTILAT